MLANIFNKLAIIIVLSFASHSANADYQLTLLSPLGTNLSASNGNPIYSSPYGLNALNQVVGYSITNYGNTEPTLWSNGGVSDLGTMGRNDGYGTGEALGINSSGQAVGMSYTYDMSAYKATLWNNGTITDLGTLGGNSGFARAISDSGSIVGVSDTATGVGHATLWSNGTVTDLGALNGAIGSVAQSINSSNQIVGTSILNGNGNLATIWSNGNISALNPLDSLINSSATAINDFGIVVGESYTVGAAYRATMWSNGMASALGALNGEFSSASGALGINAMGHIVGVSTNVSGVSHAVLWVNGVAIDLNSLLSASDVTAGWVLSSAYAINNNGSIVGFANNSLLNINSGYLLSSVAAVPEINSTIMLIMGLGLFGFMLKRRQS